MMKILLLMLLSVPSFAGPYFRVITDPSDFTPVAGALIDMKNPGETETSALVPLITHSPSDGCLFPKLACEDWTPLAVGGGVVAGRFSIEAAPLANLLPSVIGGIMYLTPASWQAVFEAAKGAAAPGGGTTISVGPAWEYKQDTNKGYLRLFAGLKLAW